jgi:hypothetical protein
MPPSDGLSGTCTLPNGGQGNILFGRPPLIVRLALKTTGEAVTIIVNHFKSKSGGDTATRPYRVAQAEWVRELALAEKAAHPEAHLVVLGDLNDFEDSAMIQALTSGGDLVSLHPDPLPDEGYTYVFNGVRQILDFILVHRYETASGFRYMHINADFCGAPPTSTDPEWQRCSDHDPLVARLALIGQGTHRVYLPYAMSPSPDATPTPGSGGGADTPTPGTLEPPAPEPTDTPVPTHTLVPTPLPSATPSTGSPPRYPLQILDILYDGTSGSAEPDEYVELRNVSPDERDLTGWHLISVRGNQVFSFPAGKRIAPGQTCRVYTNEDHPESCGLNWRSGQAIWANGGDKAELRDAGGLLVDHRCYGDREGQCP